MNSAMTAMIQSQAAAAIAQVKAVQGVHHLGLRGELREIVSRQLLTPFLPPCWGIGSGEVISAFNDHSPQMDIVIYDRSIVPPALVGEYHGLFPVEAVLATVEVKSVLNATELVKADASARKVRRIPFSAAQGASENSPSAVLPIVFAFGSDINANGKDEGKRYEEQCGKDGEGLMTICVAGRGYWQLFNGVWNKIEISIEHGEVLAFLADIFRALQDSQSTRRRPNLRGYFTPP